MTALIQAAGPTFALSVVISDATQWTSNFHMQTQTDTS
jgi:hypothetical protein